MTTITGTLVDSQGQVWSLASVSFRLQKNPTSNDKYTLNGSSFNTTPPPVITDAAGYFTISLPSNNEISPDNSFWQATITPDASSPSVIFNLKLITGTLDISSLFTSIASVSKINSKFIPRAYSDAEVIIPPNAGQLYYNVVEKNFKYYENGIWNPLGTGGGGGTMIYPPAGIAVSTGSGWAASISPASLITYPPPGLANSSGTGWLLSIDPTTLQRNISLTTTGNSGPATFIGTTLNIPQYTGGTGGMVYPPAGIAVSDGTQWQSSIPHSSNAGAGWTVTGTGGSGGLNLLWNLSAGNGETDFINDMGPGSLGGFRWYNATGGAVLTNNTTPGMELDTNNALHVTGAILGGAAAIIVGTITAGNTHVRIGDRAAGGWTTGSANINADTQSFVINAPNGAGSILYFNFDQGGSGVQFCNGAGVAVGSVSATGAATFNAKITSTTGNIEAAASGAFISAGPITFSNAVGTAGSPLARLMLAVAGQASVSYPGQFVYATWSSFNTDPSTDTLAIRHVTSASGGATGWLWSLTRAGNMNLAGNATIGPGGLLLSSQGGSCAITSPQQYLYLSVPAGNGSVEVTNNLHVSGICNVDGNLSSGGIVTGNQGVISNQYVRAGGVTGGPNMYWDGGSSYIDGYPNGRLLINASFGEVTPYCQVNGILNVHGSFQIGETAPAGQVLTGNGTYYVPQPIPPTQINTVNNAFPGAGRVFGTAYQNATGRVMYVSGSGLTDGGHVGSMRCVIGPDQFSVSIVTFVQTSGATVTNGSIGFHMTVPSGWWYRVDANTNTNNQGTAVQSVQNWTEMY